MKTALRLIPALALVAALSPLRADEITDIIDTGKSAYESGDYSEAISSLDYAAQLVRQKKGQQLKSYLPEAPTAWEAAEAELEAASGAVFGGGITASRRYTKGTKAITIKIMSDSPMMQATMMLIDNSGLIPSGNGIEQVPIKGLKGVLSLQTGETSGDLKLVVDRRYLVEISGSDIVSADLITLAEAFDYRKLAKLK